MRAQYYASQGVGLSVVLENPPNHAQLIALDALHSTTPGTRFTAELYQGGELIDSVTEYGEFVLTT